jgi:hypothetical protein
MKEYSELERGDRSYDWWVQEKAGYIELDVFNFYDDVELDWEDDTWIFQYQPEKGDIDPDLEVPILRYDDYVLRNTILIFGKDIFENLLKEWFNNNYQFQINKPVKSVTTENS